MMLYMFIMIYGQMVMTSIIEEKNNRVLEIVVSSVRPNTLMLGKILGIGLVAVTQILIWGLLVCSFSKWIMPLIVSSMSSPDFDLLSAIGQLGDPAYVLMLFVWIMLFLIGGYMFYSSIYAAIGSAVDNIQDASQLTSIAIVPIILGFVFSMSVANDPNSGLAFWLSIIPFTSPMVMMARIPFGIPRLGNSPFACAPCHLLPCHDMDFGQNLPRRHLHVRQETLPQRPHPLGPLQITYSAYDYCDIWKPAAGAVCRRDCGFFGCAARRWH